MIHTQTRASLALFPFPLLPPANGETPAPLSCTATRIRAAADLSFSPSLMTHAGSGRGRHARRTLSELPRCSAASALKGKASFLLPFPVGLATSLPVAISTLIRQYLVKLLCPSKDPSAPDVFSRDLTLTLHTEKSVCATCC